MIPPKLQMHNDHVLVNNLPGNSRDTSHANSVICVFAVGLLNPHPSSTIFGDDRPCLKGHGV